MIKNTLRRLLIFIIPLLTPLFMGLYDPDYVSLTSDICPPLSRFDPDYLFNMRLKWRNTNEDIYEIYSIINKDTDREYYERTETHYVTANSVNTLSLLIDSSGYYGYLGAEFTIQIVSASNNQIKHQVHFTIYPTSFKNMVMKNYVTSYNSYPPIAFKLTTGSPGVTLYSEQYRCDGYVDYFKTDYYYRFQFKDFYFRYKFLPDSIFTCEGGMIVFKDKDNLFPNVKKDKTGISEIPLRVETIDNKHYIYIDTLYVEPHTLDISTSPLPGYSETNYLFFPFRKQHLLTNYSFTGYILKCGAGKTELNFTLDFLELPSLFGDCQHSQYCVEEVIE